MAHELEMVNGKAAMFYVGETPWHGLGTKLDVAPSTREAIVAAGLDWEVGTQDLYTSTDDGELGELVSHKATYRTSDGKILGVVGPGWHPLQNRDAFKWFDPFVASGQASLETAGSLRGGRRVWILARLGLAPSTIVKGDEVEKFILLSNSHDGTLAIRAGFTPIRVVCANTLAMAHNDDASKILRIRHTKNVVEVLDQVRDIMNVANAAFEATADQFRFLASRSCVEADLRRYVNLVFAPKRVADAARRKGALVNVLGQEAAELLSADEVKSRVFESVFNRFEKGRGNDMPGVKGTYWAAYNAVTEYICHDRGKSPEGRLNEAWFGQGFSTNRKALKVAMDLAEAA